MKIHNIDPALTGPLTPAPLPKGEGNFWLISIALFAFLLTLQLAGARAAAPRTIQLNADTVTARDGGQMLEARGHVVISDGRLTIRADHVLFDRKSRQIQMSGNVRVTTPQGDLVSGEAAAQLTRAGTLEAIQAFRGVTARSTSRILKADRVAYQAKDDTLAATGNVVVTFPPDLTANAGVLVAKGADVITMTGRPRIRNPDGFIEGDRLEVVAHSQIAFVRGNVVSVFAETRITSATATLLVKENSAIFRDKVSVTRPGRTMTAELVTYYYKERRLVAEGQTTIRIQGTP